MKLFHCQEDAFDAKQDLFFVNELHLDSTICSIPLLLRIGQGGRMFKKGDIICVSQKGRKIQNAYYNPLDNNMKWLSIGRSDRSGYHCNGDQCALDTNTSDSLTISFLQQLQKSPKGISPKLKKILRSLLFSPTSPPNPKLGELLGQKMTLYISPHPPLKVLSHPPTQSKLQNLLFHKQK